MCYQSGLKGDDRNLEQVKFFIHMSNWLHFKPDNFTRDKISFH
ncbi:unnamed protein product [Tenebrio molitor]|jgi:hypothetical protein|nr:unnamed protein product [Tenebrio molitor]